MIYLITGVPGSGKTLYAVSTLIRKLAAERLKGKDGELIERRIVVDGIPNLLIPHESMVSLVENERGQLEPETDGDSFMTWFDWCKPGDVLVVDEVQRYLRPRALGAKPPDMVKMLETHRHFGVDIVFITQNPMLVDQNVRRLVGRHIHVRRLFGMARAVVYSWDACSVDVHRTKGSTMSMWSYPKSAYKLYKSSELHTKQRQRVPLFLIVPVLALVLGVWAVPRAYSAIKGSMTGQGVGSSHSSAAAPVLPASQPVAVASAPVAPASALASSKPADDAPHLAGCFVFRGRCSCTDQFGAPFKVDGGVCEARTDFGPVKATAKASPLSPLIESVQPRLSFEQITRDVEALRWLSDRGSRLSMR
ncbi:MAG: hypothetical protein OJF60_001646 [Burkholderiaceae bacterium]|jgi:zona occludens toxin|nr:MAG: hypothetical protein OJF60_001646 [Burkholderiaceae bacterium]